MKHNTIIGLDLAKRKFHAVIMNDEGKKISSAKIMRDEVLAYFAMQPAPEQTLVAMEACAGCHFWANQLHKIRQNTIAERVAKTNSLMGSLHEFGYVSKLGKARFAKEVVQEIENAFLAEYISQNVKNMLLIEAAEIANLLAKEAGIDKAIIAQNKASPAALRLQTINGIGPINASVLEVCNAKNYQTARDFAASLGLVPKQNTTGGKVVLGSITKQGNRYARTMLVQGARTIVMRAKNIGQTSDPLMLFAQRLLETKSFNKTAVAVANKMARIAWAVSVKQKAYAA